MPNRRLEHRITLAFVAFGLLLTLTLGSGVVAALRSVETQMLDDTLRAELAYFRLRASATVTLETFNSRTTTIHIAALNNDSHIPTYLRALPVGSHDVTREGRNYRVLVERSGDRRYIVQFDDSDIRRREKQFFYVVLMLSGAMLIAALTIGWVIASRISAPLRRLANDVTQLELAPEQNIDVSLFEDNEIGFLAKRVHHYHDQLNQLLAREREFAGNVSHELRTPLTNISLAAEVLASNARLSEKERERVQRIQRSAREMAELVDTFLILAKAEGTEPDGISTCNVNAIARDVVEQQKVWLYEKPVEVVFIETAALYVAAPIRVIAVLIANLVRNAFRYTTQGTVTITLQSDRLTVQDTGPGIDSALQARLFKRHVRGAVIDPDGSGLGLAIVQRICERYGWRVTFESKSGCGSQFDITFSSGP